MIAKITGTVDDFLPHGVIVDVAGVGYEVLVTPRDKDQLQPGIQTSFYIAENIKEDEHSLYGFSDLSSRSMYYALTSVSGVGPKAAMAILSTHATDEISDAIMASNITLFSAVSGVGKKTAQRIILDLKGKLVTEETTEVQEDEPAYKALVSLGYKPRDAQAALKGVPTSLNTQERVKQALKVAQK